MNCIFCKIISKDIPCHIVYEDDHSFAFLDARPINPGHTLVIPKKHSENLHSIEEADLKEVIATVQKIANAVREVTSASGINIGQNNGASAGQAVFHTHFHVIPRNTKDGLKSWHRDNPDISNQGEIAERIQKLLA